MSIGSEINRLNSERGRIRTAIINKGISVPTSAKLADMPNYISLIKSGVTIQEPDLGEIILYPNWIVDETNNKPDLTFTLTDYNGFSVKPSDFEFQWPGLTLFSKGYYGTSIWLDDLYTAFSDKYGSDFDMKQVWGEVIVWGTVNLFGGTQSFSGGFDLDTDNNGVAGYDGAFKCYLK